MTVTDGKFEGNAEVGERRVEITAYRTKTQNFDGMKGEVKESLIPDRYNLNTSLTASVTPQGPNTFTFEVKSKDYRTKPDRMKITQAANWHHPR